MFTKKSLVTAIITLAITFLTANILKIQTMKPENKLIHYNVKEDFKNDWKNVDSLDSKGLPKSALEIVDKIYKKALASNNAPQVVKARIYQLKYKNIIEENAFETILNEIDSDSKIMKFPYNAIYHSLSAELYWMYYQNNRWKFSNRSETANFKNDDIKTWDLNKLTDACIKHYLQSIKEEDSLKRVSINDFNAILNIGSGTNGLRPTLFDFLANRAISFFSNKEISLSRPADYFELKENYYFDNSQSFSSTKIVTNDTLSLQFYGIKVLQKLIKFHINDEKPEALIDVDLTRLKFVYSNSINNKRDSLYLQALLNLHNKYQNIEFSTEIAYQQALTLNNLSVNYSPKDSASYFYKTYKLTSFEICKKSISQYPKSSGAIKCKNLISQIEDKNISFNIEEVQIPNKKFSSLISYKNIENIWVKICSLPYDEYEKISEKQYGEKFVEELLKSSKTIYSYNIKLPTDKDYNSHTTEILIDSLPYGHYVMFISQNKDFSFDNEELLYKNFMVTNISFLQRRINNGSYDLYVMDRFNGEPLANVNVKEFYSKYNYTTRSYNILHGNSYTTNELGYVNLPVNTDKEVYSRGLEFKWNNQTLRTKQNYYNYYYNNNNYKSYSTIIFTDRAIYRPGQTIYYKGIIVERDSLKRKIVSNFNTSVSLIDPNYQTVAKAEQTTNEFGTFNGTFQIPMGLLNGSFQISTPNGSISVSVEEYKRPKFETTINKFNGNYRLNDSVDISGKAIAYSGQSISEAKVTYRIIRTPIWRGWWWCPFNQSSVEIENGKTVTNENGEFKFKFKAIPDLSIKSNDFTDFNYQIYADVTDINGETQSDNSSITVGYSSLIVDLNMPSIINNSEIKKYDIITNNLNEQKINAKGTITISKLEDKNVNYRKRLWKQPDKYIYTESEWSTKFPNNEYSEENDLFKLKPVKQMQIIEFNTSKEDKFEVSNLSKYEPGLYLFTINSIDSFGKPVTNKKIITIYNESVDKLPLATAFWFVSKGNKYEPGEIAKFIVGTCFKNSNLLYEVEHQNKIILKKWIKLSDSQSVIELPIENGFRGNVSVHFRLVSNNRVYSQDANISVPYSDKELKISFESFRNKLLPGQNEEWKIKITGPKGEKLAAEMVAALYDKSLDALRANYWYFNVFPYDYMQMNLAADMFNQLSSNQIIKNYKQYPPLPYQSYDELNWFGFYYNTNYYGHYRSGGKYKKTAMLTASPAPPAEGNIVEEKEVDATAEVSKVAGDGYTTTKNDESKDSRGELQSVQNVKARTNLNETAFFYPNLNTDEDGNIIVKFTVPEALTAWKMLGFAHTKNLEYGLIENELVTQKDLMVVPNLPRFFRENDTIQLAIKISNLTDKELNGEAKIILTDPVTQKQIANILMQSEESQKFHVNKKGNTTVNWTLKIPEGVNMISVKTIAVSGNYSDGEESAIPVMSNRMLVTESLPLPIRGNSSKTFKFNKLIESANSTTIKSQKYTLEFTSNPAWYAVQALPYIIEYPYECSEQTFSRYYANSLATHIANSSPKIKSVFDSWKNTPNSQALLSNLEKNQDLKSVLLQETPWVLDAIDETQRKRNIGLLFDLNKMSYEMQNALKKLEREQSSNGGWPWFAGMPESRYITQHIICGFGHLINLKVINYNSDNKIEQMLNKGVNYLDERMYDDYKYLLKHYTKEELQKKYINYEQIQYLYARSFYTNIDIPNKYKQAFNYFKLQSEKYWLSENKYMQGMIAIALNRFNSKKVPQDIVKSLRENSITNDELGMYWKDVESGYYWWQAPIETQALLIEAFDEVSNDQKSVEEMKIWLLKQKQTQDWKTTKATVEAIYALLLKGTDLLSNDQLVEIVIANQKIEPSKIENTSVEAGTGYFKTSWLNNDIKPEMGNITITKKTEGVAWGAVYWQYFEQLDKITPHETPLKLKKQLFVERLASSGKIIEPISNNAVLKVGDKVIVRIELRVDRSMEFVHMKDMRASSFEPINVFSQYKYQDGLGYYESTKDASTNFFIDYLPKGTYVFEYPLRVQQKGNFSNGITSIQCMYAPEFSSHSEGIRVKVE